MTDAITSRRSLVSGLAAGLAAFALGGSRSAGAQARVTRFQPARHSQDGWLDSLPGKHRTFIDTSTVNGGGTGLLYAYNLYEANKKDYSLQDRDVAVVVCFRHASTAFGFNDAMWEKYGKTMNKVVQLTDPKTKQPPTINLYYSVDYGTDLPNYGSTIQDLVKAGTHFAICGMASRGVAESIATETAGNADAIYRELMANTVPNSHVVSAGVLAVNRAQEYGYTLLTAL
jgi:intracellular sulfur oxidation DsrE/DsrF family protein